MKIPVILVFLIFLIGKPSEGVSADLIANKINVTFVVPDKEGPLFWQLVKEVSIYVSKSIDVNFHYIHSDSDRFAGERVIKEILSFKQRPDYLIFRPFLGSAERTFKILESNGIRFITIEKAFSGEEATRLGLPREKFKFWLGQINYDDKSGGRLLVETLLSQQKIKNSSNPPSVIGIAGDFDSVSMNRQAFLSNEKNARSVLQIFPMYWDPNLVRQRMRNITKRYPNANIYWSAGDQMAFEVIDYFKRQRLPIPIVGSFDWLPESLDRIANQEMTATVGGHFLVVAQALIRIVDYENGIDRFGPNSIPLQYEVITFDNVTPYREYLSKKHWKRTNYKLFLHHLSERKLLLNVKTLIELHQR